MQECAGPEISKGNKGSIDDCGNARNGVASMFALGTNDFGVIRCYSDGCTCLCETGAADDGTCDTVSHKGYHLYRFEPLGNYLLRSFIKFDKRSIKCYVGKNSPILIIFQYIQI